MIFKVNFMKKAVSIICLILLICCCASQRKEVILKSIIKLEGKNTNIRELIDIDGYYTKQGDESLGKIYFEDGIWVSFSFKSGLSDSDKRRNLSKSIVSWRKNNQTVWGIFWGVYQIKNDTIIEFRYDKGTPLLREWYFDELRSKIIDRHTIQTVYLKNLLAKENEIPDPWRNNVKPRYFIPADSLPSSDCWLKEEKWIWRNEEDWNAYRKKIKQAKK